MAFNADILNSEVPYDICYRHYLDEWNKALQRIEKMDIRIVAPNVEYFANQYRAVEG